MFSGFPACKPKGNPQGNGHGSVPNVMDRVGRKRHTAGKPDNDDLKNCGSEQADERPLNGPNSPLSGKNGWVDSPVGMDVGMPAMIRFMGWLF